MQKKQLLNFFYGLSLLFTLVPTALWGAYCTPYYTDGYYYYQRYITDVNVNGTGNSSGNNGLYQNFTSTIFQCVQGVPANFSVQVANINGYNTNSNVYIWADFDGSETFNNGSELLYAGYTNNGYITGSFQVPAGVAPGNYRMRVVGEVNGNQNPCYSYYLSEFEDYTLHVVSPYCIPDGISYNTLFIQKVSITGLNKNSGDDGGYADYTALNGGIGVPAGSNPFKVQLSDSLYVKVWIDANQDLVFDSVTEVVFSGHLPSGLNTATLDIPETAASGSTRMRVLAASAPITNPCSTAFFGEAEDYKIQIIAPCAAPVSVVFVPQTPSSIAVVWQASPYTSTFQLNYRIAGSSAWIPKTATTNSTLLSNLTAGANYEIRIRSKCGTYYSNWINLPNFDTGVATGAAACTPPTTFAVTGITHSVATVYWQFAQNAYSYQIRYRPVGYPAWSTKTTYVANRKLTLLQAGSNYEYQVRASCSNGWTAWSSLQYFNTTGTATRLIPFLSQMAQTEESDEREDGTPNASLPNGAIDAVQTMRVFPNPTNGFVRVEVQGFEVAGFQVISAVGVLVKQMERGNDENISLSDLPQGTYLLVAIGNNGERFSKVLTKI